jgi:hypothetical protein
MRNAGSVPSAAVRSSYGYGTTCDKRRSVALIVTSIVTVLLLVPGLVYAWYLLDEWIDDDESYARVIASIEKH